MKPVVEIRCKLLRCQAGVFGRSQKNWAEQRADVRRADAYSIDFAHSKRRNAGTEGNRNGPAKRSRILLFSRRFSK